MGPAFSFNRYEVLELCYKPNAESGAEENSIKFEPSYERSVDSPEQFRCTLSVELSGAVDLRVVIRGHFTSNGILDESEIVDAFSTIGFSVLFPYARSIVSQITSLDGLMMVTLPLVNATELMESLDEESED